MKTPAPDRDRTVLEGLPDRLRELLTRNLEGDRNARRLERWRDQWLEHHRSRQETRPMTDGPSQAQAPDHRPCFACGDPLDECACEFGTPEPPGTHADPAPDARDILVQAADEIEARATLRDCPAGERSMAKAMQAWWVIYGDAIKARGYPTETEGWELQSILKKVRGSQGHYHADDYVDDVGYVALAAESAARAAQGR